MLLLSKLILFIFISVNLIGLTTAETPLFNPAINARDLGLSKASFSDNYFNNLLINPSAIANTKGISIQSNEYLGIDYSSITFVNTTSDFTFGIHYIGSTITDIKRTVREGALLKETDGIVPYAYHALSFSVAREANNFSVGIGIRHKTLILDNLVRQSLNGSGGIGYKFLDGFKFGFSLRNYKNTLATESSIHEKYPILSTSLQYDLSKRTKIFMAFIENKNEVITHATFHYSIEHYMNDYIPVRYGIDHNRYTFGIGVLLDPFEIDIGWAQSRDSMVNDQVTIGFSYGFEEKNHLY